jgi:hypothetical protein
MRRSALGVIFKIIFTIIGFLLTLISLAYLGEALIYNNYCTDDFHLFLFITYLIGALIIGLLCCLSPEKSPLEDFVFVIHQSAAFAAVKIMALILIREFPDFLKLQNAVSIAVIVASLFILASFIKLYRFNPSRKNNRYFR